MSHLRTALRRSVRLLPRASTAFLAPIRFAVPLPPSSLPLPTPLRSFTSTTLLRSQDKWSTSIPIAYSELKPETVTPSGEVTLIDVREPSEVAQGIIPSAVNVPLSVFKHAFNPTAEADFEKQFAFKRPEFGNKIVVYCRSGKRSQQALETLKAGGWKNVRNYEGSYLDWVQHEEANSKANQDDD
ncbi:hypothetical protein ACQY0O_005035 [Thecaphora frezii]